MVENAILQKFLDHSEIRMQTVLTYVTKTALTVLVIASIFAFFNGITIGQAVPARKLAGQESSDSASVQRV